MAIGERIKLARQRAGLSLRDLAEGAQVSAQAISKYERGLDTPSSGVLLRLSRATGVTTEFFLRPRQLGELRADFRKLSAFPKREQDSLLARVRDWLERYLEAEDILGLPADGPDLPDGFPLPVAGFDEIEAGAERLREGWDLGLDPIERLTETLEEHGIKVEFLEAPRGFDACALRSGDLSSPVAIAVNESIPGDRQRFTIAHEVGHLVLDPQPGFDAERACHRFAAAFLVPRAMALTELGPRRTTLDPFELHLLKDKYGISMQAWIYRAKDLGVLPEASAARLFQHFRMRNWHRTEPWNAYPQESTERLQRLVLHALAEDIISDTRAAELLGTTRETFRAVAERAHQEGSAEMGR